MIGEHSNDKRWSRVTAYRVASVQATRYNLIGSRASTPPTLRLDRYLRTYLQIECTYPNRRLPQARHTYQQYTSPPHGKRNDTHFYKTIENENRNMKHTTCLFTPARALHRLLLLELAKSAGKTTVTSSTNLLFSSALRDLPTLKHAGTSGNTLASCRRGHRAFSTTPSLAAGSRMVRNQLRDKAIPFKWVRVADASGTLSAPQPIDRVLAGLAEGYSLVMVAPPPPPPPPTPGAPVVIQPSAAICRIIDAAAEKLAAETAAQEAKQTAQQTKTLELNWAIAPHDLAHKIKRLEEFLDRGLRVEVMLARKRGSRKATSEEGKELVEKIQQAANQVPGVTEYKKMDGFVGGVMKMFFEGPIDRRKVKKNKNGKAGGE
ncbi:hypothetical protein GQX73_g3496 [Xylaria multiplex]|uniref:Translation initiation factor 3 C-terminal domain-containing protein n=1 Tax=Xylaria multiplex TaxID=323545 RepID=A0A7C8MW82_9PEZI|nr:hypothetical protein GQX73_g3496 [Xylaria multiplex]